MHTCNTHAQTIMHSPCSTTLSTVVFSSVARNPRNEKTTNPANIDVAMSPNAAIRVSLKESTILD